MATSLTVDMDTKVGVVSLTPSSALIQYNILPRESKSMAVAGRGSTIHVLTEPTTGHRLLGPSRLSMKTPELLDIKRRGANSGVEEEVKRRGRGDEEG